MYKSRWVLDDSLCSTPSGKRPRPSMRSIRSEMIREILQSAVHSYSIYDLFMICSKNTGVRTRHIVFNNQVNKLMKLVFLREGACMSACR